MKKYKQNEIDKLAEILKKDGVISVPTDTVYGLCAQINSQNARDNLVIVKNRPLSKSFPVMCADEEQIKSIAIVNEVAQKLIIEFMPGPITLVLKKRQELPEYVTNGTTTIAVRMATSKALKQLIQKIGCPIFMSSANKSGEPTCSNLKEIEKIFPNIDGIMEGNVEFGQGSTIVDCTSNSIKVLRNGPITMEQIMEVLKKK